MTDQRSGALSSMLCPGCGVGPGQLHAGDLKDCPVERAAYEWLFEFCCYGMGVKMDMDEAIIWDPEKQAPFCEEVES